jgi:hypothetical protein
MSMQSFLIHRSPWLIIGCCGKCLNAQLIFIFFYLIFQCQVKASSYSASRNITRASKHIFFYDLMKQQDILFEVATSPSLLFFFLGNFFCLGDFVSLTST